MTTIFYGYGFGLFGHVDRWTLYLFCAGMWAVMLLWSKPWLDRFIYGPLEWLWSRLARGRSEEHTSELQSLMRISYADFCLKKNIRIILLYTFTLIRSFILSNINIMLLCNILCF